MKFSQSLFFKIAKKSLGAILCSLAIILLLLNSLFAGSFVLFISLWILGTFNTQLNITESKTPNISDTTSQLCRLFALSQKNIYIFSNSLSHRVFNNENVLYQLRNAKKRGVEIEVIVNFSKILDLSLNHYSKPFINMILNDISLYHFQADKIYDHFIVIDSKHIRIEKQNSPQEIKTHIILETPTANKLSKSFTKLRSKSSIIAPETISALMLTHKDMEKNIFQYQNVAFDSKI